MLAKATLRIIRSLIVVREVSWHTSWKVWMNVESDAEDHGMRCICRVPFDFFQTATAGNRSYFGSSSDAMVAILSRSYQHLWLIFFIRIKYLAFDLRLWLVLELFECTRSGIQAETLSGKLYHSCLRIGAKPSTHTRYGKVICLRLRWK